MQIHNCFFLEKTLRIGRRKVQKEINQIAKNDLLEYRRVQLQKENFDVFLDKAPPY